MDSLLTFLRENGQWIGALISAFGTLGLAALTFLQENGQWIGALISAFSTLVLVAVNIVAVLLNRSLVKQNRVMAFRDYYVELIGRGIVPCLAKVRGIQNMLATGNYSYGDNHSLAQAEEVLGTVNDVSMFKVKVNGDRYYIPYPQMELMVPHLDDLKERHLKLAIEQFDRKSLSFRKLLGQFAKSINEELRSDRRFAEVAEHIPYLTEILFNKLLFQQDGAFDQFISSFVDVNETKNRALQIYQCNSTAVEGILRTNAVTCLKKQIQEKARSLHDELGVLEEKLSKARCWYIKEYGITESAINQYKQRTLG